MSRSSPRPWRATAHKPNPYGGRQRALVSRTSARTRAGLNRFVTAHESAGHEVTTWRLVTLEEAPR